VSGGVAAAADKKMSEKLGYVPALQQKPPPFWASFLMADNEQNNSRLPAPLAEGFSTTFQ